MKITREIKTAILVIASILLFIWGYSFLKGTDLLSNDKIFYVQFDNVEGLVNSAPVTISGLNVGKVKNIKFVGNNGKIQVEFHVNSEFSFSKSSRVYLYEPGLIAGKQLMIAPNFKDSSVAESGATLVGEIKPGLVTLIAQKLTPLQEKVEKMVVSADDLLANVNSILDSKTKADLKNSISNLEVTIAQFKEVSKNVNAIVTDNKSKLGSALTNVDKAASNFEKFTDSINKSNIGNTIKKLEKTLESVDKIMADIQSGKGTIGKFAKDDAIYNNIAKSSRELELLLQDLRLNPTRYVNVSLFGKKNKPYKSPVTDSIKNKE